MKLNKVQLDWLMSMGGRGAVDVLTDDKGDFYITLYHPISSDGTERVYLPL